MEFESILLEKAWSEEMWNNLPIPSSFADLNLDIVINDIKNLHTEYRIAKYFYKLPEKKSELLYRQGIVKDLEKKSLFQGILSFSNDMKMERKYKKNEEKSTHSLQQACWCMDGAFFYSQALLRLYDCIVDANPEGIGFQRMVGYLRKETESEYFQKMEKEARSLMDEISSITYRLDIIHNRVIVDKAERGEKWDENVDTLLHNNSENTSESKRISQYMENPFGSVLRLSDLELYLLEVIERSNREYFTKFHVFYKKYHHYMNPILLRFEEEVQFYIGFLHYSKRLNEQGFSFSYPLITEHHFQVEGCYDMALAEKNMKKNLPVIRNDLEYREGEQFFVITGPNQGGKTTFARSIGQVAYFAMLGLTAPCEYLEIPLFENVLTHFATEESVETGAGKLKEELNRLAPMMKAKISKNLVLINELFTTAATYDAYIMGNRVMKHFMKNGCIGIYVTHIQELENEEEGIVSLLAEVDEKDSHIRTYKMYRRPAGGSGYAADIVEKYHLSYEDLKRRLAR